MELNAWKGLSFNLLYMPRGCMFQSGLCKTSQFICRACKLLPWCIPSICNFIV